MNLSPSSRITPWVGRLIIANAVVLLLLMTVFTSPALFDVLKFTPSLALRQPWTFLLYYLSCGLGAALFSVGLQSLVSVGPFVGASGAVLGVAVAFAMFWPDAELLVFPIPIPLKARTFLFILLAFDFLGAIYWHSQVAHVAHLGGALSGYLFLRVQALSRRSPHPPPRAVERVVMVQSGSAEPERRTPPVPLRSRRRPDGDPVAAEVDRVLDKINEKGIGSLTPAERRFLDEVAKQKKQEN